MGEHPFSVDRFVSLGEPLVAFYAYAPRDGGAQISVRAILTPEQARAFAADLCKQADQAEAEQKAVA